MASSMKAMAVFVAVMAMCFVMGSAQEFGMAPAPSPSRDTGAASLSVGMSGAMICSSLFLSVLALLKN